MKAIPLALGLFLAAPILKGMDAAPVEKPVAGPNDSKLVQVQVEFIDVSHETLTDLLFLSQSASSDSTELRKKVQELVKKKDAKVIETLLLTSRSGQKTTTESIQEKIYPTEYEPPALPGSFGPGPTPPAAEHPPRVATPTAFDTRNCGSTLEAEPQLLDDGKTINLRLVPEMVWHTGNTVWQDIKDDLGNSSNVQMPDFYTLRLNTQLICVNGHYQLAAALSPKNDKGEADTSRKVMVFVKCNVLAAE